jgi:hypothetical protein
MAGEGELLAEVGRIVDDRAEVELHRDLARVLVGVDGLIARGEEIRAMRRTKGKTISPASLEVLGWIHDELAELARALDPDWQEPQ